MAMMLMSTGFSAAAEFQPTLLHVEGHTNAGGMGSPYPIDIPVIISGTPARVIFAVFTRDDARNIPERTNGYLGWHYVNKVDTCVYFSPSYDFDIGTNSIHWDARDMDGNMVQAGAYTYYLWAYDNRSEKQAVSRHMYAGEALDYIAEIQEVDEAGLPLANPIWYTAEWRWKIGSDPDDKSAKITTTITLEDGWHWRGDSVLQPDNFDYVIVSVADSSRGSMQKIKFVSGGDAEIDPHWGVDNSYADMYSSNYGESGGVCSDGTYLFTTDVGLSDNDNILSDFYIYDTDGFMVADVDLSSWLSSQESTDAGGVLNGGPVNFATRKGHVVLNSHASCLNQMINPARYLDSDESSDLFVWSNGNGDYTGDKNFEETAENPWLCNDNTVGPYKRGISVDRNLFSVSEASGLSMVSFALFAPDGTGMGYYGLYNHSAEDKYGIKIISSNTPYDGIYCDRELLTGEYNYKIASGLHYVTDGIGFVGYDCYRGMIPFYPCDVDEEPTPSPVTLSPNHPNPFNPVTSIPFTLATESEITLIVYNVAGEKVATLADGQFSAGAHSVSWNASAVASGMYFYRLTAGKFEETRKMTLVK